MSQELLLPPQAFAIAHQIALGANDPMAGNDIESRFTEEAQRAGGDARIRKMGATTETQGSQRVCGMTLFDLAELPVRSKTYFSFFLCALCVSVVKSDSTGC